MWPAACGYLGKKRKIEDRSSAYLDFICFGKQYIRGSLRHISRHSTGLMIWYRTALKPGDLVKY